MKGGSAGRGLCEMMRKPAHLLASDHSNGPGDDEEVIKEVLVDLGGRRRGCAEDCNILARAAMRRHQRRSLHAGEQEKGGGLHRSSKSLGRTSPGVAKDLLD